MTQIEKALSIIKNNVYLTLATANEEGPWATPVYYAYDNELNFYFHSRSISKHSKTIRKYPQCAVAIFDSSKPSSECDGVQISGSCLEINDSDALTLALSLYFKRTEETDPSLWGDEWKQRELYLGDGDRRFYIIKTQNIFKPVGVEDKREEISLKELKVLLSTG